MSRMHDPAHPGEVLREWIPEGMTVTAAAEQLGVSLDSVQVAWGDTEMVPLSSWGTGASRVTFVAGNAVKKAADDARRQVFEIRARL